MEPVAETLASFRRLRDLKIARLEPMRIRLERVEQSTTLRDFYRSHPSVVPVETVATLNQVGVEGTIPAGKLLKKVVGFNPDRARVQPDPG